MTSEALVSIVLSAIVCLLWLDDFADTRRFWLAHRDARSLRAFLLSTIAATTGLLFVVGALAVYLIPELRDFSRTLGYVVRGLFVIVGAAGWWSRHQRWVGAHLEGLRRMVRRR